MTQINLLPENLRDKEEKELKKLAKRRKVLTMEMALPRKEKKDRPWWRKSFSAPPKPSSPAEPPPLAVQKPSSRIDLLSAARKQKLKYLRANGQRPGRLSLIQAFGSPRSPFQPPSDQTPARPEIKAAEKRESFWSGWFKPKPRKLKLVVHAPPSLKPLKTPETKREEKRPVLPSAEIKEKKVLWLFKSTPKKPKLKIKMDRKLSKIELPTAKPARISLPPRLVKKEKPAKTKLEKKFHLAPKAERSFDINLMPRELAQVSYYPPGAMIAIFLLAVILPAILVIGAWWGVKSWQARTNEEMAAVQEEVDTLKQELSVWQEKQKKSLALQRKLLTLKDLLAGKVYWTNFLDRLEKYTLDGVYYTNFAADVSGEFVLPAVAKDYGVLAKQIVALREAKDFVREAKVENIRLFSTEKAGISGVSFDLKLYLSDNVFSKK